MKNIYRIIDANINRVAEGLRVLEDLARFKYGESFITEEAKKLRHAIRKEGRDYYSHFISCRDSENDSGLIISQSNVLDNKADIKELVLANFKRVQEGLRVIEENLKIAGYYDVSKIYEQYRFAAYALEKKYYNNLIKRKVLQNTDLYCLTAEEYSKGRSNIAVVKELLDAGIKIIQYREKDKKMIDKYRECAAIRKLTQEYGADFIVNDHIDLAVLVEADGVHIGQDDLPPPKVRELVGEKMFIGISTHSPKQAEEAVRLGADYIGVGPIFKTATKKDVCEPVGLEYLEYAVKNVDIPFVAIGGIKEHNVAQVVNKGARCVAMVTEIVGAESIRQKIESVRNKINQCK